MPEVTRLPDQAPLAVQLVALVDVHVRVEAPPAFTVVGLAERETVGGGAVTVTVTARLALPPAPVHVRVKVLVALKAPVLVLPAVARAPLQLPEALHAVAFVEDQVSVEDCP